MDSGQRPKWTDGSPQWCHRPQLLPRHRQPPPQTPSHGRPLLHHAWCNNGPFAKRQVHGARSLIQTAHLQKGFAADGLDDPSRVIAMLAAPDLTKTNGAQCGVEQAYAVEIRGLPTHRAQTAARPAGNPKRRKGTGYPARFAAGCSPKHLVHLGWHRSAITGYAAA